MAAPVNQELSAQHKQEPAQGAASKACLLFELGTVRVSAAADDFMVGAGLDFVEIFSRHARGDFGLVDKSLNAAAIRDGWRVMSTYSFPRGDLCVVTSADRTETKILLPSEY